MKNKYFSTYFIVFDMYYSKNIFIQSMQTLWEAEIVGMKKLFHMENFLVRSFLNCNLFTFTERIIIVICFL